MENEKQSFIGRAAEAIFSVSGAIVAVIGLVAMIGFEKLFGINQKPK